ncbi:hypothetical protein EV283_2664 [Sphingomonas sp. BK036]|uniref:hypothetical protein n=1 Tax=Sphingomonas sp. BK036 TaxID=2512122 RepID=UPI00102A2C25|nr:hypothetical protein [Sphingomonas sp. BK036]RZT53409.1 hypothetical protein EV283_2664 [Sphingomonas sp. BK036]
MSFSTVTNIMTMLFCTAVLIQSIRLMRCLKDVKGENFAEMVVALDTATSEARNVLADLRETLRVDCAANARVIASGTAMREELTVMAGIADAVAERIVEAVGKTTPPPKPASKPKPKPRARSKPADSATSVVASEAEASA